MNVQIASGKSQKKAGGFTLAELLAVLCIIALGALLIQPALAKPKANGKAAACLNNQKRLILAWQMYQADNNGLLVSVLSGGQNVNGSAANDPKKSPWALGWLDWTISRDNTNDLFLTDSRYSKLSPFLQQDEKVFKCPSDTYLSPSQQRRGWTRRVRSYSGNSNIGDGNYLEGPSNPVYKQIRKITEFQYPGPHETWIYAEEHPDSINDPAFFNPTANWIDWPAPHHEGASSFSFADGHVELHKWQGSLAAKSFRTIRIGFIIPPSPGPTDPDIGWVSYRGGRSSTKTFGKP